MYEVKIFTLYPEIFPGPLASGIYGKAMSKGLWSLKTVNIRNYAEDKHKTVDDTVIGGGSGMLMKPDVVAKSLGSQNPHNMIRATISGLTKEWSPRMVAQRRGKKVAEITPK